MSGGLRTQSYSFNPTFNSVTINGLANIGSTASPTPFTQLGLMISTDTAVGQTLIQRKSVTASNGNSMQFLRTRGTAAAPSGVIAGDGLGGIQIAGYNGTLSGYVVNGLLTWTVESVDGGGNPNSSFIISTYGAGSLNQRLTIASNGTTVITGTLILPIFTVATLPAGTAREKAFVSDALAPVFGAAVVGGGTVTVPVYYTGTAWFVG